MFDRTSSTNIAAPSTASTRAAAIQALHDRCGIYTKPEVACRILDGVGWRSDCDLSGSSLLEPAAGDGEFVVEAARRLVISCSRLGRPLTLETLKDRIRAFELHRREARRARRRLVEALRALGVRVRTAEACARAWIVNGDFLLAQLPPEGFTHTVGNPPYVRWAKIPSALKAKYERRLPQDMIGGDLFLPFLDRALTALKPQGRCGFLCSDRWRFMAFAEAFRQKWLPLLSIRSDDALLAVDAFREDVDSYPSILIAAKTPDQTICAPSVLRGSTLADLGYVVKVGPALGHTPAFVLQPDERDVEPKLLRPWIDGSEIAEGSISWRGRHVVIMYDSDGKLIDLKKWPRLGARLRRFRKHLKLRSIVRNGAPWFRPIDRICATDWARPKLLVPELAKVPRIAIDLSGAIPSHGVYAIFAPQDDVGALYGILCDGRLGKALEGIAPKVKGGYVRCYRRFLLQARVS